MFHVSFFFSPRARRMRLVTYMDWMTCGYLVGRDTLSFNALSHDGFPGHLSGGDCVGGGQREGGGGTNQIASDLDDSAQIMFNSLLVNEEAWDPTDNGL